MLLFLNVNLYRDSFKPKTGFQIGQSPMCETAFSAVRNLRLLALPVCLVAPWFPILQIAFCLPPLGGHWDTVPTMSKKLLLSFSSPACGKWKNMYERSPMGLGGQHSFSPFSGEKDRYLFGKFAQWSHVSFPINTHKALQLLMSQSGPWPRACCSVTHVCTQESVTWRDSRLLWCISQQGLIFRLFVFPT